MNSLCRKVGGLDLNVGEGYTVPSHFLQPCMDEFDRRVGKGKIRSDENEEDKPD